MLLAPLSAEVTDSNPARTVQAHDPPVHLDHNQGLDAYQARSRSMGRGARFLRGHPGGDLRISTCCPCPTHAHPSFSQELVRLLCLWAQSKAVGGLRELLRSHPGAPELTVDDRFHLALTQGFGHGLCHSFIMFVSMLPLVEMGGTYYVNACPRLNYFLAGALLTMGMSTMLVYRQVPVFKARERRRGMGNRICRADESNPTAASVPLPSAACRWRYWGFWRTKGGAGSQQQQPSTLRPHLQPWPTLGE